MQNKKQIKIKTWKAKEKVEPELSHRCNDNVNALEELTVEK